jgi:hypothetical protein
MARDCAVQAQIRVQLAEIEKAKFCNATTLDPGTSE